MAPAARTEASLALTALAVCVGCWDGQHSGAAAEAAVSAPPPVDRAITALGRLEPEDGIFRIAGPSGGGSVIAELRVDEGGAVKRGDVIAVLDTVPSLAADVAQLNAELDNAKHELSRHDELNTNKVISESLHDELATKVRVAEARLAHARAELERAHVRSPIDGRVLYVHAREGEQVDEQGIVELGKTDHMFAIAEVYEDDVGQVHAGQRARVKSPVLGEPLAGTVERVHLRVAVQDALGTDPAARKDARVVEVEVRLDDSKPAADLTNLQVEVEIKLDRGESMAIALGWLQLRYQKVRLLVAISGIAFAVILILMQLGFRASLLDSSVRYQERLRYDIAILSPETLFVAQSVPFSSRRLYQAGGVPGVAGVSPLYVSGALWKNPFDHVPRRLLALGIDPVSDSLDAPGVRERRELVRRRDALLFDALSRPEYGPVAAELAAGRRVFAELNDRRIEVVGLFEVGTSFGIDGSVLTSEDNFLRLFPARSRTQIDVGLVRLDPGADAAAVRDAIEAALPDDVLVLPRSAWIEREKSYWMATTPIGAVFSFGVVIGLAVGAIIVYQILFADVSDHLPEYATLKAMGYSNRFLFGVVIQQAVILAALGFVPGALVCVWLYRVVGSATRLPMQLDWERAVIVLALTIAMCAFSGALALRKVRALDPADVF